MITKLVISETSTFFYFTCVIFSKLIYLEHDEINHWHTLFSHSCRLGNTFYLIMPTEQGESFTDDPNDPSTPTASSFPEPPEEVMSLQTQSEEDTPAYAPEPDKLDTMQVEEEKETGQSQAGHQSHVIRNVDEIFHTIEGLMSKLRQLKVSLCSAAT